MLKRKKNDVTIQSKSKSNCRATKLTLSTPLLSSEEKTETAIYTTTTATATTCSSPPFVETHMELPQPQLNDRDKRLANVLLLKLQKLSDFDKKSSSDVSRYADTVILTLRRRAKDNEEFRDLALGIIANVHHLNGEIATAQITPEQLGEMEITDMLSPELRAERRAFARKRAREQTNVDKTSMMCDKCGLVRRDRLNVNEVGLDSEENGTHFEYNFENVCTCDHSNSSSSSSSNNSDSDRDDSDNKSSFTTPKRDNSSSAYHNNVNRIAK